jgi:hypothetical protein
MLHHAHAHERPIFHPVFRWYCMAGVECAFTKKSPPCAPANGLPSKSKPPSKEDREAHHLRNTLQYAQVQHQHRVLSKKQNEQDAWQQRFGAAKATELDQLSGVEFKEFLTVLFRSQGHLYIYAVRGLDGVF